MEKQEFKDIWLPLSDGFYRVAYSILGSESDARDALQDLYIKLWNLKDSQVRIQSPAAYGARILRNICIDRIRSRNVRKGDADADRLAESGFDEPAVYSADRIVMDREMLVRLSRAMDGLPETQRTVVEMRYFSQMSYSEISGRTGISAINVRVLVSRAKKTLRAAMKEVIDGN